MKKSILVILLLLILLLSLYNNFQSAIADETNPYTIYGTVKDENKMVVKGAIITVKNLNTKEENIDGNDTITGSPIVVTTDSQGEYSFELINLKSGYSDRDEIVVTAEKDGIIGSNSVIVEKGSWGKRVDISPVIEDSQEKEQWNVPFKDNWMFLIIILLIVVIMLLTISTRRKSKGITSTQVMPKRELPPPPSGYKYRKHTSFHKERKESRVPEENIPEDELPPPEDEIPEEELPPPEDEIEEENLPPPEDEEEQRYGGLSRIGVLYIILGEITGIILMFFINQNIKVS